MTATRPAPDAFDDVIVGSGPAGSVPADRRRSGDRCVLEAGIPDRSRLIRIPVGFVRTLHDPALSEAVAGRAIPLLQGRVVGGSSSVNGLA